MKLHMHIYDIVSERQIPDVCQNLHYSVGIRQLSYVINQKMYGRCRRRRRRHRRRRRRPHLGGTNCNYHS